MQEDERQVHMKSLFVFGLISLMLIASGTATAQTSSEHAPGTEPHFKGVQAYEAGRFWQARTFFRTSARFADKLSQVYLGAIYYNGEGVEADRARGWAWFELAAERDYPHMVDMAEDIWAQLSPEERTRGQQILEEELRPEFGDEVALPRTERRMRQDRRRMTGSRLGSSPGLMRIYDGGRNLDAALGSGTGAEVSPGSSIGRGRYDFYSEDNWDLDKILEREARLYHAQYADDVRVRDVEGQDSGDESNQ